MYKLHQAARPTFTGLATPEIASFVLDVMFGLDDDCPVPVPEVFPALPTGLGDDICPAEFWVEQFYSWSETDSI